MDDVTMQISSPIPHSPLILPQQAADEIFGLMGNIIETLRIKLPLRCSNQS